MHEQLLQQARRLARLDPKKPRQSNLRRAVSSIYYAMFHFLIDQACRMMLGTQHHQTAFRHVLARAFEHSVMKSACVSFSGGTLKATVTKGLPPSFSVPVEIKNIARAFVELQEKRHFADYDLTERFDRADVLGLIHQAENTIRGFTNLTPSNEKKFFLACLLAWKTLANR